MFNKIAVAGIEKRPVEGRDAARDAWTSEEE